MSEPTAHTTETVSVRTAILRAADYIQAHPDHFHYANINIPNHCETKACAAGWVAHFMGKPESASVMDDGICESIFGVQYWEFDERMDNLEPRRDGISWMHDPLGCAETLRAYANAYHPEVGL